MNSTQIEIAKRIGCSHATVSRALAGSQLISEATRRKVLQVAEELGYRRNAVVSHLMTLLRTGRDPKIRSAIAYLTSFPHDSVTGVNPNYEQYYLGAKNRAESLGYHLDVIWRSKPGLTRSKCNQILHARGIRSFIVAPRERPLGHLSMEWAGFACAALGHTMPKPHLDCAMADHFYNTTLALRAARRLGYHRIGLVITARQYAYFPTVAAAFALHLQHSPPEKRVPTFLQLSESDPAGDRAARDWLKRHQPDCIFCSGFLADALLDGLGLRVPSDIGLADLTLPVQVTGRAGIFERTAEIGASAVDLVVHHLHHNELGPPSAARSVRVEGMWIDGISLPACLNKKRIEVRKVRRAKHNEQLRRT